MSSVNENGASSPSLLLGRRAWIQQQLRRRLCKCSHPQQFSLLVASYNVNDQPPPILIDEHGNNNANNSERSALEDWLLRGSQCANNPVDLVVIGLQEMDLSNESFYYSSSSSTSSGSASYIESKEYKWLMAIQHCLNSSITTTSDGNDKDNGNKGNSAPYELIATKRLVGLMIVAFVRPWLKPHLRQVSTGTVTCGVLGVVGNKGAVGIRMRLFNHVFTFVNAHLAAHSSYYDKRCADFDWITKSMTFPTLTRIEEEGVEESGNKSRLLDLVFSDDHRPELGQDKDQDVVIWLGDLNFRLDLNAQEARLLASCSQYDTMFQRDQLIKAIQRGDAFVGFQEMPVMFPPTFKYDLNTINTLDTSDKQRCPSWTDRILWKINNNQDNKSNEVKIEPMAYWCSMELMSSDHKPVAALFRVHTQRVDVDQLVSEYQDVLKQWDGRENASIPQTHVDVNVLNFGQLFFNCDLVRILNLNVDPDIRQTEATFQVSISGNALYQWLKVQPVGGSIVPGHSQEIKVRIVIDGKSAFDFNYERVHLGQIFLVIQVQGGKDHFVALEGIWRPSVFGRRLYLDELPSSSEKRQVPNVVQTLVDTLNATSPDSRAFFDNGPTLLMNQVIEQLDAGLTKLQFDLSFSLGDIYVTLAQILLTWLDSIPEGKLIPRHYDPLITQAAYERRLDYVVDALDPIRQATFLFVMDFLKRHCKAINLSPRQLSYVCKTFALAMFEGENGDVDSTTGTATTTVIISRSTLKARAKFIKQFLV